MAIGQWSYNGSVLWLCLNFTNAIHFRNHSHLLANDFLSHITEMGCWHWWSSLSKLEAKPSRDSCWYSVAFLLGVISYSEVFLVFNFQIPPEQIRNEPGEDFLHLLKEWDCICRKYGREEKELRSKMFREADQDKQSRRNDKKSCEYEVERLVDICYGDPTDTGKRGLKFKVKLFSLKTCLYFQLDK